MIEDSIWWRMKPGTEVYLCHRVYVRDCDVVIDGVRYLSKAVDEVDKTLCHWPGVPYQNEVMTLEEVWEVKNDEYWEGCSPEELRVKTKNPLSLGNIIMDASGIKGNRFYINDVMWFETKEE